MCLEPLTWFWFRRLEGCETGGIKRAMKRHVAGLKQLKRIWEASGEGSGSVAGRSQHHARTGYLTRTEASVEWNPSEPRRQATVAKQENLGWLESPGAQIGHGSQTADSELLNLGLDR